MTTQFTLKKKPKRNTKKEGRSLPLKTKKEKLKNSASPRKEELKKEEAQEKPKSLWGDRPIGACQEAIRTNQEQYVQALRRYSNTYNIKDVDCKDTLYAIFNKNAYNMARAVVAFADQLNKMEKYWSINRSMFLLADTYKFAAVMYYHLSLADNLLSDAAFDRLAAYIERNKVSFKKKKIIPNVITEEEICSYTSYNVKLNTLSSFLTLKHILYFKGEYDADTEEVYERIKRDWLNKGRGLKRIRKGGKPSKGIRKRTRKSK